MTGPQTFSSGVSEIRFEKQWGEYEPTDAGSGSVLLSIGDQAKVVLMLVGVSAPFSQFLDTSDADASNAGYFSNSVQVFSGENKYTKPDLEFVREFKNEDLYQHEILVPFEWMESIYKYAFVDDNAEVIAEMCSHIESYMASGDVYLCDLLLSKTDYDRLGPDIVVSMLRFMFPVKQSLVNWEATVELARVKVDEAGYNSDVVLRGLI